MYAHCSPPTFTAATAAAPADGHYDPARLQHLHEAGILLPQFPDQLVCRALVHRRRRLDGLRTISCRGEYRYITVVLHFMLVCIK